MYTIPIIVVLAFASVAFLLTTMRYRDQVIIERARAAVFQIDGAFQTYMLMFNQFPTSVENIQRLIPIQLGHNLGVINPYTNYWDTLIDESMAVGMRAAQQSLAGRAVVDLNPDAYTMTVKVYDKRGKVLSQCTSPCSEEVRARFKAA